MKFPGAAFVILMFISAQALPADSGEDQSVSENRSRPKIGLALSGGGARGGAHVGVLKALEELSVPIDYIAGTSMGAIIGGMYAAGYSADEIGQILEDMNWADAMSDQPHRREQTMRKKDLDAEFLIPHRIGFNKGGIQLPLGVIEGQHLDQVFQRLLLSVQGVDDFDQLSIPFRAVATDLVTGDEVVLSGGSLADALRASMSVPGAFAPVQLGGRQLVDGGMANNLPVSVVRAMGADIVIAVDISSPLLTGKELTSVVKVAEQLTGFLTRRNTEEQIASLKPGDILLIPELGGMSAADFENSDEIAKIGLDAAMARREDLAAISVPLVRKMVEHSPLLDQTPSNYLVQFITINNGSVLDDEIIRAQLDLEPGQSLDISALENSVDRIYGLDVFESVTYNLVSNEAGYFRVWGEPGHWAEFQHNGPGPNGLRVFSWQCGFGHRGAGFPAG